MIQPVGRRINSSVAFNKCDTSFAIAQTANMKGAQQQSSEWERSARVFTRFKPRETLAPHSVSFSLFTGNDLAGLQPAVILALAPNHYQVDGGAPGGALPRAPSSTTPPRSVFLPANSPSRHTLAW